MILIENATTIQKADARSAVGARLNQMALEYMAYTLAGSEKKSIVSGTFRKLWKGRENRFSHQYAFEARVNGQTLGMITCYPVRVLRRLSMVTPDMVVFSVP